MGWPAEYGGQARTPMDQLIFTDEAAIAGAPVPFLTINSVAPTIMAFGTDEQKTFYLPKIAAGDIHFAIGYSTPTLRVGPHHTRAPPGSGTDRVLSPGGAVAVRHLGAEMCRCYHGHVGVCSCAQVTAPRLTMSDR